MTFTIHFLDWDRHIEVQDILFFKENLEDEIMKRRLLEDEIHKLKHELTDIKYPPDSVQ